MICLPVWIAEHQAAPENALRQAPGQEQIAFDEQKSEIVVVGRLPSKRDGKVLDTVSDKDIRSSGADSIGDAVARVARRLPSTEVSLLVNGRLLANTTDVTALPAEAIQRIEILAPSAGVEQGLSAGSAVINIVLRPNFRSLTLEGDGATTTAGAGRAAGGGARLARIDGNKRSSATLNLRRSGGIRVSDRFDPSDIYDVDSPEPNASLTPKSETFEVTVGHARSLGAVNLSLSADGAIARDARFTGEEAGRTPNLRTTRVSTRIAATLDGHLGSRRWSVRATGGRLQQNSMNQALARAARQTIRSVADQLSVSAATSGPITRFADLNAQTSLDLAWVRAGAAAISSRSGLRSQAGLAIPVLRGGDPGLNWGSLSVFGNVKLDRTSDSGTTIGSEYGLNWSPSQRLNLSIVYAASPEAVATAQLYAAREVRPQISSFDPRSSATVFVDQIFGGNPDLRSTLRERLTVQLTATSRLGSTALSYGANYAVDEAREPVFFPVLNAEVEAAFPERFVRDDSGRLLSLDARPINADWQRSKRISFSINLSGDAKSGVGQNGQAGIHWTFGLTHEWLLSSQLRLSHRSEVIDLLGRQLAAYGGGAPRHALSAQGALSSAGMGTEFNVDWRSATELLAQGIPAKYSYPLRINLQSWFDVPLSRGDKPSSVRFKLGVENLLNARPNIRLPAGEFIAALRPYRLDPAGRMIRGSIRIPLN